MQTVIHRASERGVGEHGWLHTRFSFSFAEWYNPSRMGFGVLRVLNDDVIDAQNGFPAHSHRDMEIITVVTEGAVTHTDSMGNNFVVPAGDVQVMSAGTGVTHSEYNHSDGPLALFQIWIQPQVLNITPQYSQKSFGLGTQVNTFECLAGPLGAKGALPIAQDAYVFYGTIDAGKSLTYDMHSPDHGVYVFIIDGTVSLQGEILGPRDAMGIWPDAPLAISCEKSAHILLFEVPYK